MKWRAWYSVDECYDSEQDDWPSLPSVGLQVLIVYHADNTRTFYDGADWYWIYNGQAGYIASTGWDGHEPEPSAEVVPCRSCLKQGTALPESEYNEIVMVAMEAESP